MDPLTLSLALWAASIRAASVWGVAPPWLAGR